MRSVLLALTMVALLCAPASADEVVDEKYLTVAEPAARAIAAEFAIPASVAAAQSILESAWGHSTLATADNNFFGFKCKTYGHGPIAIGCREYPTTECDTECHPAVAIFRVYASMTDSFRDYGRHLTTSPYYAAALAFADDPDAFITEVGKRYATDPEYAPKVIRLMVKYNLYRFDRPE
jgi:flagellar protein FlgJ